MSLYADGPATDPEFHQHGPVLEWLAHPAERGQRASHAIPGEEGYWLVDPIDAPGLDDRLAALDGDVAGAVVCTKMHARDAGRIARRHDVDVHVPAGLDRAVERIDGPVTRTGEAPIEPGIDVHLVRPLPGWCEAILAFGSGLYVPEQLGTAPTHALDGEQIGAHPFARPVLSTGVLADRSPEAGVFFGHGRGVTERPGEALADALAGARRRVPRALVSQGPAHVGAVLRNFVLG